MKTKKMFQKPLLAMFIICSLVLTSCKEGPQGPKGATGNANVNTYTYNVYYSDWLASSKDLYVNLSANFITQDINDNGTVLVYISNGSNGWLALPQIEYTASNYFTRYSAVYYVGGVTIWKTDSDGNQTSTPTGTSTFKIVAIQGYAGKKSNIPTGLNTNNYNDVKRYYCLSD